MHANGAWDILKLLQNSILKQYLMPKYYIYVILKKNHVMMNIDTVVV